MHEETPGCLTVQARERGVTVPPSFSARAESFLMRSIFSLPPAPSSSLSVLSKKSLWLANLEPSGIPSLYFPVRSPLARGDQIVLPRPYFSCNGLKSTSTFCLWKRLYCDCSVGGPIKLRRSAMP